MSTREFIWSNTKFLEATIYGNSITDSKENYSWDLKSERVNTLTPKSNEHLISCYNITHNLHIKVMNIKDMITI